MKREELIEFIKQMEIPRPESQYGYGWNDALRNAAMLINRAWAEAEANPNATERPVCRCCGESIGLNDAYYGNLDNAQHVRTCAPKPPPFEWPELPFVEGNIGQTRLLIVSMDRLDRVEDVLKKHLKFHLEQEEE